MDKDLRRLIKRVEAQGFTVRVTSRGHVQISKDGQVKAVFAGTPSDRRSWLNGMAALKRAGFNPNEK